MAGFGIQLYGRRCAGTMRCDDSGRRAMGEKRPDAPRKRFILGQIRLAPALLVCLQLGFSMTPLQWTLLSFYLKQLEGKKN